MSLSSSPCSPGSVVIPVSRSKSLRRAATYLALAALLEFWAFRSGLRLELAPSGTSNRFVEFAWLGLYAITGLIGLSLAWRGFYWLMVTVWRGKLQIRVDGEAILVDMGPMGRKRFDSARVHARYPYDDPERGDDGLAESLKNPSEYREKYLPILTHPQSKDRLDLMIRFLCNDSESDLARRLADFVRWRRAASGLGDPESAAPS